MNKSKWDLRFLDLAKLVSTWSKDPSTKCGAVVTKGNKIVSLGFNGFPIKCDDDEKIYSQRDLKYERVIHAEPNAILFATQSLQGCTIYTQPFPPCSRCAALIIQSGITRVVAPILTDLNLIKRWKDSLQIANQLYLEADIDFEVYSLETKQLILHYNGGVDHV